MPGQTRGGYGGSLGWSVGLFSWLDSPNSKVNRYWRVIEQGSNESDWPWQGKRVVGLWGPNAGPRGKLISGDLSAFQSGRGDQKFVPFFKSISDADQRRAARAALYYFFGGGKGKNMELLRAKAGPGMSIERSRKRIYFWLMTRARVEDMPFVQGVILREIQAGDYYKRAAMSFDPVGVELREIQRVMGHVYGTSAANSPAGLRKGRQAQADDASGRSGWTANYKPKTGRRRTENVSHKATVGRSYVVSYNASATVQDFIRTSRGTISQYTSEMTDVNKRVSAAFQAEVIELMRRERRRPMSGALLKAHDSPRNRTP